MASSGGCGNDDDHIWGDISADSGFACIEYVNEDDEDGDGANDSLRLDPTRVARAVDGATNGTGAAPINAKQLRAIIDEVANGSAERRREVVNLKMNARLRNYRGRISPTRWGLQSALTLAHLAKRYDLAGVLVGAGASPRGLYFNSWQQLRPLAACAAYGYADGVRELLRAGQDAHATTIGHRGGTAVHAALSSYAGLPSLEHLACVEVLVKEGGASIEARDLDYNTPLLTLQRWTCSPALVTAALDMLVGKLGADANAKGHGGRSLLFLYATPHSGVAAGVLRALLAEYGASANVVDLQGWTPLMVACRPAYGYTSFPIAIRQDVVEPLLRASSFATRRAVRAAGGGKSAADLLVEAVPTHVPASLIPAWLCHAVSEISASGATILPANAARAQQMVAAAEAEAAAAVAPATQAG